MPVEGLQIRRAEPDDCSALYEMFTSPKVYEGTLQLPYPSREQWRKRIAETDSCYNLVAVSGEHVIGIEAHVHVLQRDERANEERSADNEHERDRNLRRNEHRAEPASGG